MAVKAIPEGYHSVTPYLVVNGVEGLMEFMRAGLGAEEKVRMPGPDGGIAHAEMLVGNSMVMMGDAANNSGGAMPAMMYLYVPDTDATYKSAVAAGAESMEEPADQFYGDRRAAVRDRWGNQWFIATHMEDPTPEEMEKRQGGGVVGAARAPLAADMVAKVEGGGSRMASRMLGYLLALIACGGLAFSVACGDDSSDEPLEIERLEYEDLVVMNGDRLPLTIHWSGTAEFPVTVVVSAREGTCPQDVECVDEEHEIASEGNPIIVPDALWCEGEGSGFSVDWDVTIEDADGSRSEPAEMSYSCRS